MNYNKKLLEIDNLVIKFKLRNQILTAIRSTSLKIYEGESLAIVGESGSGKSVLMKSLIGIIEGNGWIDSGSIIYKDLILSNYTNENQWLNIRGKEIAMVFQDPMTSLNPLMPIGNQIIEAIKLHQKITNKEAKKRVLELLADVGINQVEKRYKQYPHEFSGGMRQRVVIAIALACNPKLLICDEPTTALDVTIQDQILKLLKKLKNKYKLTIVYITHDFGVVANIADRVAVMYAGDVIEIGLVNEIFYNSQHPYTWALLSSLPQLGNKGVPQYSLSGTPPNLTNEIQGDAYAPRNTKALMIDFVIRPPEFSVSPTHKVKSWLLDTRAPKVEPPEHLIKLRMKWEGNL